LPTRSALQVCREELQPRNKIRGGRFHLAGRVLGEES